MVRTAPLLQANVKPSSESTHERAVISRIQEMTPREFIEIKKTLCGDDPSTLRDLAKSAKRRILKVGPSGARIVERLSLDAAGDQSKEYVWCIRAESELQKKRSRIVASVSINDRSSEGAASRPPTHTIPSAALPPKLPTRASDLGQFDNNVASRCSRCGACLPQDSGSGPSDTDCCLDCISKLQLKPRLEGTLLTEYASFCFTRWKPRHCAISNGKFRWWKTASERQKGLPPMDECDLRDVTIRRRSDTTEFMLKLQDTSYSLDCNVQNPAGDTHAIDVWIEAIRAEERVIQASPR
jgi:hypothetical protein